MYNVNNSYRKIEEEMSFGWVTLKKQTVKKINNMYARTKRTREKKGANCKSDHEQMLRIPLKLHGGDASAQHVHKKCAHIH